MLSQNYLLPIISVLAENTLLKTACHFLLLLVGFDTLSYRKDYDRSPILVCHQEAIVGVTTSTQQCYDGDQGVEPVTMEIMTMLWRWRSKAQDDDSHIMSHILIACDVYLSCILFFLERR